MHIPNTKRPKLIVLVTPLFIVYFSVWQHLHLCVHVSCSVCLAFRWSQSLLILTDISCNWIGQSKDELFARRSQKFYPPLSIFIGSAVSFCFENGGGVVGPNLKAGGGS